jgi:hypothetical protein
MDKNKYQEPNKITLVDSMDKTLDLSLTLQNIRSSFRVTRIWSFNPRAMDNHITPLTIYTTT